MDLETRIIELSNRVRDHRDFLLTEEAAKNALVMPFLQMLGYDVFNPSEVIPEFTCDVGIKRGEKVDYAICQGDEIHILIECKPASAELSIASASQLFRYFSTTDARVAVLTNGIAYKFFSDIDVPNRMDEKPFFTLDLEAVRKQDLRILEKFTRQSFDIAHIVEEAAKLKLQSLVYKELVREFADPSEEFVRLVASRVRNGRLTGPVKDPFRALIVASVASLVRDRVTDRLTSALNAFNPNDGAQGDREAIDGAVLTTEEEVAGFTIIRAIAAKLVDPRRVVVRDAKSYCAVLLDDNNRKTIARMHFNSPTSRYLGLFTGKEETRHSVSDPVDLYRHDAAILGRIEELTGARG